MEYFYWNKLRFLEAYALAPVFFIPARILLILLIIYLAVITFRRIVLTLAAMTFPPERFSVGCEPFDILAIIPARNESEVLGRCLESLLASDWPKEHLKICVVDDGSSDSTASILESYAGRENLMILKREGSEAGKGKPAALNEALSQNEFGEAVYVLDADAIINPETLKILASALSNNHYDAVQGSMLPRNSDVSLSAFYSTLEHELHQGITLTGAAGLDLTVSLLGSNYLIRRNVLEMAGAFNEESRLEDIDLSVKLLAQGRRIGFFPQAYSSILASRATIDTAGQRRAWSSGFFRVTFRRIKEIFLSEDSILSKTDRVVFSLGYADRIVLLTLIVLGYFFANIQEFSDIVFFIFFAMLIPAVQCVLTLYLFRRPAKNYFYLLILPIAFIADILASLVGFIDSLRKENMPWIRTKR